MKQTNFGEMSTAVDRSCKSLYNFKKIFSVCPEAVLYIRMKAQSFQRMLNQLTNNPKQLFLLDSIGALLTGTIITIIAAGFPTFFGMPQHILFVLAGIAFTYVVYSFCCYYFMPLNWRPYLTAIIIANTFYGVVTIGLVYYFYNSITRWGLLYFIAELIVISVLLWIEYRTLSKGNT